MSSHKAGRTFTIRGLAIISLLLLGSIQIVLPPPVVSQEVQDSGEVDLGIIVTATAEEAERLRRQLNAGADFGELAKGNSIDPTSNSGGYLGRMRPVQLRSELRDALNGVKTGQLTNVVRIPAGFAILKILTATPNAEDYNPKRLLALTASGTIHYGASVAGLVESDAIFMGFPKPDGWNRDLPNLCGIRKRSHADALGRIAQFLAEPSRNPGTQNPNSLLQAHSLLAQLHGYMGDMDKAIDEWRIAYQIAQTSLPGAIPNLQESLGAAYLHRSEMENGIHRDSTELCIFPPANPRAQYGNKADSKLAVQYLLKYLEDRPDDLEVRWLLNLSYMTLGEYPSGVPPAHLIPISSFESKESIGRFVDVGPAAGLNIFTGAGGVITDDFDNDGLLDIFVSSVDLCDPLNYFRNNGDGSFTNRRVEAGLSGQMGGLNMVQADYNNDGCMDLLILRGGWEFPVRRSLLRNNCDGTFTDVTDQSGVGDFVTSTQTAAFADIDNDGHVDLFVGNENSPGQLFRNQGNGRFEDISSSAGIDRLTFTKGVAAGDYDNDGYVDFFLSNHSGLNFLYHNNRDRTFTEVGRQAGVQAPWFSFATWFFDYDNDGWLDLFVTGYQSSVSETMRTYLRLPPNSETLKLYRNLRNGTFENVAPKVGLDKVFMPMGSNFGDVDNDGFLDIYLGNGQPSFTAVVPYVLLRNKEGKSFVDITASSGTGELHKGHAIAFADLDRSGHEAIVTKIGGAVPADKHTMRVFKNPGSSNDWINVRLVGTKSNRAAIGAQIKITVENDGGTQRSIYRRVGGTSSFGSNPLELHIGLGHEARIVGMEVWWPASNTRQQFSQLKKNQFIEIKESASEILTLERRSFRLGGSKPATVPVKQAPGSSKRTSRRPRASGE